MNQTNERAAPARFAISTAAGSPQITIPARSSRFMLAFLLLWLCVWTIAGYYVSAHLASASAQPGGGWSIALWLVAWAIGEVLVLATLLWFATGAQIIRIKGSDLEAADRILHFERKRSFRGTDIRDLHARDPDGYTGPRRPVATPINRDRRNSSVAFDYAGRKVYLAMGLDKAEGQIIVDQLSRHLPSQAVARG